MGVGRVLTLGRCLFGGKGRDVEGRDVGRKTQQGWRKDFVGQVRSKEGSGPVLRLRLKTSQGGKMLDGGRVPGRRGQK